MELSVVIELLKLKLSFYTVQDYVLVKEINETTGQTTIHAYLKLAKKTNIVSESFLDLNFKENVYHGNYKTVKQPKAIISSIVKHVSSKYDEKLLFSSTMNFLIDELGEFKNFYTLLIELAEQGKVEKAIYLLKINDPELYIKEGKKIETHLKYISKKKQSNMKKY